MDARDQATDRSLGQWCRLPGLRDQPTPQAIEDFGERGFLYGLWFATIHPELEASFTPEAGRVNQLDFQMCPKFFVLNGNAKASGGAWHG